MGWSRRGKFKENHNGGERKEKDETETMRGEIPEICKLYWEKKKNKGENVYSCPRSLCVEKKYAGV